MRVVMVQLIGAISTVYQSTLDRIVVFVLGNDNHLYDKYGIGQDGYGEPKEFLPVSVASGPPAPSTNQFRPDPRLCDGQ